MSSLVAVVSLFLVVASLLVVGGVAFAIFFFGLFVLALVGVLSRVGDRTVSQHDPPMEPTAWRDGS